MCFSHLGTLCDVGSCSLSCNKNLESGFLTADCIKCLWEFFVLLYKESRFWGQFNSEVKVGPLGYYFVDLYATNYTSEIIQQITDLQARLLS